MYNQYPIIKGLWTLLTCHNGFSVSLLFGLDPDELLSEVVSYICIAVHKQPHRVIQAQPHQLLNLSHK